MADDTKEGKLSQSPGPSLESINNEGDYNAQQCSDSSSAILESLGQSNCKNQDEAEASSILPNLFNKFVNSFEKVVSEIVTPDVKNLQGLCVQPNSIYLNSKSHKGNIENAKTRQKLVSLDLEGVSKYIKEERPSIILMVGAGISTSAGIPDFRTPGSGLYDKLAVYDIPSPHAIFDISYFKKDPTPFFVIAKELFNDNIKPTPTHYFIHLLNEKKLMRRCFTQNIDSLEYLAGINEDKIVAAHGSHRTSTCLSCKKKYDYHWLLERLRDPQMKVPKCEHCIRGIVKPDIIFFGESLPSRFFSSSIVDFPKCELLIIMGTSLVVQPFASLVEAVPVDTPRLLVNLTAAGQESLSYFEPDNVRDVFWQGNCDDASFQLARLLGWEYELKALIKAGNGDTSL